MKGLELCVFLTRKKTIIQKRLNCSIFLEAI